MADDVLRRANAIFNDALAVEPSNRMGYVSERCAGDDALCALVERLLAADERAAGVFDSGPGKIAPQWGDDDDGADLLGTVIGRYRLLRLIATGGMGAVYEAEQDHPHRRVALKVLRSSLVSRSVTKRFTAEAEILAHLKHPHIAQVYEAGWHDAGLGGVPWFAMELVEGAHPLIEHADREGLGVRGRLELFALVCDAVQHGHGHGFIHRDLKPANILVDGDGNPRIIDFGVARSTDVDVSIATMHTSAGELVGTLKYMSPEQCAGDPNAVGIRSDVYALGVVLHELLTGESPYDLASTSTTFDLPRVIRESNPRPVRNLDRSLPVDLETIVLKCLQKEPERRYQTVDDLGRDIRHFLGGEAIVARRDHAWYVLRKALLRHRVATAVAAAFVLLLASATVALSILYGRAESQRIVAEGRAESLRRRDYVNSIALANAALREDKIAEMDDLLERCPEDLRGWEWWHLRARSDDSVRILETADRMRRLPALAPRSGSMGCAVSASLNIAALGADDGSVCLVDVETGATTAALLAAPGPAGFVVTFSPDGSRVAARSADVESTFWVWNVADGALLLEGTARDNKGRACLTPDNRWYLTGDAQDLVVYDIEERVLRHRVRGEHWAQIAGIAASADGRWIVSGGHDGVVQLWRAASMEPVRAIRGFGPWVTAIGLSPDGGHLMVASAHGAIARHHVPSLVVERVYERSADPVREFAWSPNGSLMAMATDNRIDVRDEATGDLEVRLHAGGRLRAGLTFLDDRRLAIADANGRLRVFDLDRSGATGELGRHPSAHADALATSPDGRWAATGGRELRITLWRLAEGRAERTWNAHATGGRRIKTLAFSPDGAHLASGGADGTVIVWSIPEGEALRTLSHRAQTYVTVAWSGDGRTLFAANDDAGVDVWEVDTGALIHSFNPGEPLPANASWFDTIWPRTIAVSPDGGLLATSGHEGSIRLWRWPGLAPAGTLVGHKALVRRLAFSPDGALLASAAYDGSVRLWDVAGGELTGVLDRHDFTRLQTVSFSPDGTRLLTCGTTPQLWSLRTGETVFRFTGHASGVTDVAFSGDGAHVVTAGLDAVVRFWTAPGHADR